MDGRGKRQQNDIIEPRMARRMAQARHQKGDERESSGSANGRQREGGKKRRGKHQERSKTRDRKEGTGNGRRATAKRNAGRRPGGGIRFGHHPLAAPAPAPANYWGPATATRREPQGINRGSEGQQCRSTKQGLQRRGARNREDRNGHAKTLVAVSGRGPRHPDMSGSDRTTLLAIPHSAVALVRCLFSTTQL